MKLKFLYAYENLQQYVDHMQENDAWEKYMITPFWSQIAEYAPFPLDYMKPAPIIDKQVLINQIESFKKVDFSKFLVEFEKIVSKLPTYDDDPITIAFYPSNNNMEEGVIGSCAWGNIIININPMSDKAIEWTPFVFAHEYHHNILGGYWYCIKGGTETKGNFLEYLINEGQADSFAQSF